MLNGRACYVLDGAHADVLMIGFSRFGQIAAQILRKLDGRSTRFEMALLPEELGRVDVKLDIDSEGRVAARLAFDNPAAATDLRGRADELRRQLQDAGFQEVSYHNLTGGIVALHRGYKF